MNRRVFSVLSLGICCFTLNSTCARGGIVSDFSTGDEGWKVVSFQNLTTDNFGIKATYNPIFNTTGGNLGGYISTVDQDNVRLAGVPEPSTLTMPAIAGVTLVMLQQRRQPRHPSA
jgi:hypothetical protein